MTSRRSVLSIMALTTALVSVCTFGIRPAAAQALTADEARQIANEAYIYFYPLVTMEVTRQQLTNVPAPVGIAAPPNRFAHAPAYPTADMRAVVRPNFDTLYSSAWLDITTEPVVITVPDTNGRYYLLPMLDMWTDVFASPGWRTTGTKAGHFLIASPTWRPELKADLSALNLPAGTQRIDSPTPNIWVIGRIKTDGPPDYDAVHKIQAGLTITPLSRWGRNEAPPAHQPDPKVDMKTAPKEQVETMSGAQYFALAADIMKANPPHLTDMSAIARFKRLGLEPGKSFDAGKADATVQAAIAQAPKAALQEMAWKVPTLARVVNGWSMNTDTMGVYGNYYLKRAIIAQAGLGANQPEDAIYPLNLGDNTGQPLTNPNRYVLRFAKADLPPAQAFWSLTMYDQEGFQVANPINRFAVSSWGNLNYNADGSLELLIQHEDPGEAKRANWLPAPAGPFNVTLRLYAPTDAALTGRWSPPAVQRIAQ